MYIRRLTYEFGFNYKFYKEYTKFVGLIVFIVFNNSIVVVNYICWIVNEIWEVGRVMTQKQ